MPSTCNPYVFNGDYVDRGKKGFEVLLLLLSLHLASPNTVFLNRGNHEDSVMNLRYGFSREVEAKYPVSICWRHKISDFLETNLTYSSAITNVCSC